MKIMGKTIPTILIAAVAVLFSLSFVADMAFAAELNLKRFTTSPSPFRKGQTIRFSLEIENPNDTGFSTTGREIVAAVKDGTPERETPGGSLLGRTPLPPTIGPRSTVTVNLAQTYTVPNNAGDQIQFTIILPPIPPGQRGPSYVFKFNASCTYSPELRVLPPAPVGPRPSGK
jgi:hypothetical protein